MLKKINYTNLAQTLILVTLILQFSTPSATAHDVRNMETVELDITPIRKEGTWSSRKVEIEDDHTTVKFPSISRLTTELVFIGHFNFSNIILEYDGLETYVAILHQTIYIQEYWLDEDPLDIKVGSRTKKLSNSALRDGELNFIYNLADLKDINPLGSSYAYIETHAAEILFKISTSLEFIRGTKQKSSFDINFAFEVYRIPDIDPNIRPDLDPDLFHNRLSLNTTAYPSVFNIEGTSVLPTSQRFHLLLPDEIIPKYFKSPKDHSLNLTEFPLIIWFTLRYDNSDSEFRRATTIKYDFYGASRIEKSAKEERFKLVIRLKDSLLLPFTVESIGYKGTITVDVKLELPAIFGDTRLYAKNNYAFSPNEYILLIATIVTIFCYKFVDYVDYRKLQNELANLNSDILAEEFSGGRP